MRINTLRAPHADCMNAGQIIAMTSVPMNPSALEVVVCPSCRSEFTVSVYRAALVDRQQVCPDCDYMWS